MAPRDKRKKIVILIIIIAPRLAVDYDNELDGTIYETVMNQMAQLQPLLLLETWTHAQEAAYDAAEAIATHMDNEGSWTGPHTFEVELETLSGNLQTALDNL